MGSTEDRIIEILKQRRSATATEIGHALGYSAHDMRYHLNRMVAIGLVERFSSPSPKSSRGRPSNQFRLGKGKHQPALERLAAVLMNLWIGDTSESDLSKKLEPVVKALVFQAETSLPTAVRLNHLIHQLNAEGYEARWEAHSDGPHIIIVDCPFRSLRKDSAAICEIDRLRIEQYLNQPFERAANLYPAQPDQVICQFRPLSGLRNPVEFSSPG